MKIRWLLAVVVFLIAGCATQKPLTLDQVSFKVIKVNRFLKMQTLRGEGFESVGRKHPNQSQILSNTLPYNNRGEEIVIIWRYDGPALVDVAVKLCFDYNFSQNPEIFRIEESYTNIFPGRYIFRFQNFGDNYYQHGEIENWRVSIYYDGHKVSEKQSAFFGKI